jgi:hypothetical protein
MPGTWGECQAAGLGSTKRCPFVRCRHHLAGPNESCVLHAAEGGPIPQSEIAVLVGSSVRQVQRDCRNALVMCATLLVVERARRRRRRWRQIVPDDTLHVLRELDPDAPHGHGPCRSLSAQEIAALYPGVPRSTR